ncbi:hypothetical protein B1T45_06545 [Mycobacterium kansasii]|uniref:Uncharacterized protein n=3 Tax=Mycobacterium kansasii TaxID=1768 RepID=A0A653ERG7_MYCKA|nr:hypothetical protein [Mycobacterium kansasii]AGZ52774.1 hypothetical protein MKAN_22555 [Mycobacterium kansasii ATCC 12478]ARG61013.1 hypothetical protein B1T45_06545 [Mycobacterium kansasii]ARG68723.1 hypothetical protein B1T47_06375 [Mycobacterium kansasii]ARG76675.1 hypothetical protein B1T51_21820 [Mycobacterium kansasii]ARG82189.1 hypothetical protein B1T52_22140 [Mycobacterium kansasii]
MPLQRFARAALAILMASGGIGLAALVGSSGVARADPDDDVTPQIIDDLLFTPIFAQDPRLLHPSSTAPTQDWGRIGMVCQNRNVKCQKNGF